MNRGYCVGLALAVVLGVGISVHGEIPAVTMERAIHTEETQGDLDKAISLYEQVIADAQAQRKYVAQAYYRLGLCYLKKGDKIKAVEKLTEVVSQYSDQKEIAGNATAQLASLMTDQGGKAYTVPTTGMEPTITKGSRVFLETGYYSKNPVQRFDIVVVTDPDSKTKEYVKRVIGLGNEIIQVQKGKVLVNGQELNEQFSTIPPTNEFGPFSVPDGEYFLLGDNRAASYDSRYWKRAAVKKDLLRGRVTEAFTTFQDQPRAPVVVSTTPACFQDDVSPTQSVLTVTFDREMMDGSWSWCGGGDTFPEMAGAISYDKTRRTCIKPTKLVPGHVYYVGINSPSHKNFKTPSGVPARRYAIVFATKGADGKPTPIPDDMIARARAINGMGPRVASEADKRESEKLSATGWQLWNARQLQDAEKAFEQAVVKDPGNANAWNGLGWAQQNQGMPLNAKEAFEKCLAIQPDHAAALNGLGWIAKASGNPRDAIKYWEKAVQSTPAATAALSGLATTYAELKEPNMVVKYARMWLDVEPGNSDAKEALKKAEANGGVYSETADAQPVTAKPLKLEPAPWTDGEVTRYSLKTGAGIELGEHRWLVGTATVNGKVMWRVEQYLAVTLNGSLQYSRVDAEKDSFAPVSGLTRNGMGDFSAVYAPGRITLTSTIGTNRTTGETVSDHVAYDNEQALFLIRRLPLTEGYSGSFDIFSVQQGGALIRCTIAVTGKERVTVRAGTFDCYKIDLACFAGAIKALQHTLWFSADHRKLLVKYDAASQAIEELVEVSAKKGGQRASFEDKDLGISFSGPPGWAFVKNPSPGTYKLAIELLPPELRAWAVFTVTASTGSPSAKTVAEKDVEALKGFFKGYTVRPASWREAKIGGVPAATFTADYSEKDEKKVEYRTYLVGKSCVYWFVFRTTKDDFELQKPEFDSLVGSFKGK